MGQRSELVKTRAPASDRMPYDEPPDWFYPTAQTTAGLLIQKAIAQDPRLPQSQEVLKEAKGLCSRASSSILRNRGSIPAMAGPISGYGRLPSTCKATIP